MLLEMNTNADIPFRQVLFANLRRLIFFIPSYSSLFLMKGTGISWIVFSRRDRSKNIVPPIFTMQCKYCFVDCRGRRFLACSIIACVPPSILDKLFHRTLVFISIRSKYAKFIYNRKSI
jgi:hypothetical protein